MVQEAPVRVEARSAVRLGYYRADQVASGTLKATCSRRTTSVSWPHSSGRAQPRSGGGSDRASCPRRRSSSVSVAAPPEGSTPPLDRGRRRHCGGRGPGGLQACMHQEHPLHCPRAGAAPTAVRLIRGRRAPLPWGAQLVRSARPHGACRSTSSLNAGGPLWQDRCRASSDQVRV